MIRPNSNVGTARRALQQRPRVFDAVGINFTANLLIDVVHRLVNVVPSAKVLKIVVCRTTKGARKPERSKEGGEAQIASRGYFPLLQKLSSVKKVNTLAIALKTKEIALECGWHSEHIGIGKIRIEIE
jgi:hypothetical protein